MKQMTLFKRVVSSVMTLLMVLSAVGVPIPAFAADSWPEDDLAVYVEALPLLEDVADQLGEGERVTAGSYELAVGTKADLNTDFSNISFDSEKVKVSFFEAKNADGQSFSPSNADTYQAVYYAEPYSGNPAYKFSRTIIVLEPAANGIAETPENPTEELVESSEEISGDEEADSNLPPEMMEADVEPADSDPTDEEAAEIAEESIVGAPADAAINEETGMIEDPAEDMLSSGSAGITLEENVVIEDELNPMPEEPEQTEYYEWAYDTVTGILVWESEEDRLDLLGIQGGTSVPFKAPMLKAATGQQMVTISRGADFHYADYGLGDYVTSQHYVSFGNVPAVAICVQPALPAPASGIYTISSVSGNTALAKVLYYADEFFNNRHPDFPAGKRFIITHLASSYANGSDDAFILSNETAQALAIEMYNYCNSRTNLPSAAMSFSDTSVKAYRDGSEQRTKEIVFSADSQQSITINLPSTTMYLVDVFDRQSGNLPSRCLSC